MPLCKQIRGITLAGFAGRVVESGGIRFLPTRFDFDSDSEGTPRFALSEFAGETLEIGADVSAFDDSYSTEFWCISRIAEEFGIAPPSGIVLLTDSPLNLGFVAGWRSRKSGRRKLLPFICLGDYHGPSLVFRTSDEKRTCAAVVAKAFWGILTRKPRQLAPLDFLWYDECEGGWANVSSFAGQVVVSDTHDDEPEAPVGRTDPHLVKIWHPDGLPCPECEGTGEESFCPAGETCEFCDGTGLTNW